MLICLTCNVTLVPPLPGQRVYCFATVYPTRDVFTWQSVALGAQQNMLRAQAAFTIQLVVVILVFTMSYRHAALTYVTCVNVIADFTNVAKGHVA